MNTASLLVKARRAREKEHRLKPSLRLKTIGDIRAFIRDKGLVSTLVGNELPSLIGAILGKPWKPTGRGFTSWLDWWNVQVSGHRIAYWLRELSKDKDVIEMRIFRDTKTLVSSKLWPVMDPIVEHYHKLASDHRILSTFEWRIMDVLEEKGPTRTDKLRITLQLTGKTNTAPFHRSLVKLESLGLIVGYEDPKPERHLHANIWRLWPQAFTERSNKGSPSYEKALEGLLQCTIEAAVLVPEKEVADWFRWNDCLLEAKEALVSSGKALRAGRFLLATTVA